VSFGGPCTTTYTASTTVGPNWNHPFDVVYYSPYRIVDNPLTLGDLSVAEWWWFLLGALFDPPRIPFYRPLVFCRWWQERRWGRRRGQQPRSRDPPVERAPAIR
jgi:hypothetical protein